MFDIATYIVTSCYIHILKVIWPNVWSFNYHLAARLARWTWIPEGHFHRYQVLLLQICGISLGIMLLNTIGCTSTQYNSIDFSTTLTSTTQRSDSSIPTITSRYPLCCLHLWLLSSLSGVLQASPHRQPGSGTPAGGAAWFAFGRWGTTEPKKWWDLWLCSAIHFL